MSLQAPPREAASDDLEALIEEARRRTRRRRSRIGGVAAGIALLLAGGYLLAVRSGHAATPTGMAGATSSSTPLASGVGPFWYMRTLGTMRAPRCVKPRPGIMNRCAATVWFTVVMSTETWVAADGTMRERNVEVSQRFASARDRARWLAGGKPLPVPISIAQGDALNVGSGHFPPPTFGPVAPEVPPMEGPPAGAGPVDVGDGLFTYRQLLALSVRPATALARIEQAWAALRHRYATMLLTWHSPGAAATARADEAPVPKGQAAVQLLPVIAQLDAAPLPTGVRLALLDAATALPGVRVTARTGTDLMVSASASDWQPISYTFDRRSGERLTGLPMDGGPPDVPGPASTVVAQGLVTSATALPQGVQPIPGVAAPPLWPTPPAPATVVVSPPVGGSETRFTVLLGATPGERVHPAPTAWLGITGSAGHGVYRGANRAWDPCLPSLSVRVWPATTIRRAGQLVYVYRFTPRRFHLRAWCAGRYELGIQAIPNPLPPKYTTPPYTGPSGTSAYVEVR